MSLLTTLSSFSFPSFFGGGVCLGVDAGTYAIKIIEPSHEKTPFDLRQALLEQAQPIEGISAQLKKHGLKNKGASFSIADSIVETHEFKLPKLGKKELETAIEWEIKKAITSNEFAYHDYVTTEIVDGFNVQCIVVAKEVVNSRFEEAKNQGFNPKFLETESLALLAALKVYKKSSKLDKVAILDLGHSSFRIIFIHNGHVSFTRSLYLGLGNIIEELPKKAKESSEVTSWFKQLPVEANTDNQHLAMLERLLQESLYTLCEEFRRSEVFAKEQKGMNEIEEVYLCGGGACVPYTLQYLNQHLSEKKIETLDLFKTIKKFPKTIEASSGPLWACALGLAMRGV